jgi:hypothetical protein
MYPHSGETGGSSIAAARKLNGSFDSRGPFHELFSKCPEREPNSAIGQFPSNSEGRLRIHEKCFSICHGVQARGFVDVFRPLSDSKCDPPISNVLISQLARREGVASGPNGRPAMVALQ